MHHAPRITFRLFKPVRIVSAADQQESVYALPGAISNENGATDHADFSSVNPPQSASPAFYLQDSVHAPAGHNQQ